MKHTVTFSTLLTLFRIAIVPFVVLSIITHRWNLALYLFVVGSITDMFDGAFARLFDESTFLGACLDPVADKALVLATYISLSMCGLPSYVVPNWLITFLVSKELVLLVGAYYFGIVQRTVAVRSVFWGKLAMAVQITALCWILLVLFGGQDARSIFVILNTIVLYTSLIALGAYVWEVVGGTSTLAWFTNWLSPLKKKLHFFISWL